MRTRHPEPSRNSTWERSRSSGSGMRSELLGQIGDRAHVDLTAHPDHTTAVWATVCSSSIGAHLQNGCAAGVSGCEQGTRPLGPRLGPYALSAFSVDVCIRHLSRPTTPMRRRIGTSGHRWDHKRCCRPAPVARILRAFSLTGGLDRWFALEDPRAVLARHPSTEEP
jgi:hypothetical protein